MQDKCAERGPAIPRVAFLFMTRGTVVHEAMWKEWFRSVHLAEPVLTQQHYRLMAWCPTILGVRTFHTCMVSSTVEFGRMVIATDI